MSAHVVPTLLKGHTNVLCFLGMRQYFYQCQRCGSLKKHGLLYHEALDSLSVAQNIINPLEHHPPPPPHRGV